MRLKIRDSYLTSKVANKCLNFSERVEVVERNKRWSPPFPCCPVNRQCLWKKTLIEKKIFFWKFLFLHKTSIRDRLKESTVVQVMALKFLYPLFSRPCQIKSMSKERTKLKMQRKWFNLALKNAWKMHFRMILHDLGRIHQVYHKHYVYALYLV